MQPNHRWKSQLETPLCGESVLWWYTQTRRLFCEAEREETGKAGVLLGKWLTTGAVTYWLANPLPHTLPSDSAPHMEAPTRHTNAGAFSHRLSCVSR